MASELSIGLWILGSGAVALAVVNTLPPLTQGGGGFDPLATPVDRIPHESERAFCEAELSGVDCACFAYVAQNVMTRDPDRAPGWRYADKWALARAQAEQNCARSAP
ncbi:hypothetical protein [Pseudoponticoccus marisrubri]|uniref:Uncharacterized protein n=1 Tax=Pseudoponticoccus marisrubri TaxID=1685382 RepID=A0A0W7WND3_9RHOB|nr:hypothetical protein [Pseudoponticoccus marisrubri]KUF12094.1 hypothetical protein AVJ23_05855 [Pseudoponticoccus marisrubri]